MGKLPRSAALTLLISLACFPNFAQGLSTDQPSPDEYQIDVNVGLVVLPVIVTDRTGKVVSGLDKDSFQVFEDGRPQQIALFEAEDIPVTVGLVIDNSGSMGAARPEVAAAAAEFAHSSNPQDQMFVVNFNQYVSLGLPKGVPFTNDARQLLRAVSRIPASGNTALYDGVAAALKHLKRGTGNRKALIVISDGGDNASHLKFSDLLKRAEASNAQIYTLGLVDEMFVDQKLGVLRRLAKATGGKSYFPQSPSQITGICGQIARDLRHQYTIGYHPSNPGPGGTYHVIRVTAKAAGSGKLHVTTRAGYWMPAESQSAQLPPSKASL